jgi:hypothetical protein
MEFSLETIMNKKLILKMLEYEESIINGDIGKLIYNNYSNEHLCFLEFQIAIHKIVLKDFNFSNNESDIQNYKMIFSYYYKSSNNYDKDIINAVSYLREKI